LVDFVEKEKGIETICPIEHKDFVDEVNFLYGWWKKRLKDEGIEQFELPEEEVSLDNLAELFNTFTAEMKDEQEVDDEMLIRLMKIRRALWT
jgi:hypothetical protein